ncbi:MAG TPA: hypothetical protein PKV66_06195 [Candidatus Pelethenecus sp.]|nr:hypothetical protein [Candidatus Pelethenecus sp.]
MAIKYFYDETYDVKGWFHPNLTSSGWFDDGFGESGSTPPGSTGQIKVYNGATFVAKPVKVYNGATFVTKPLKRYNGSIWVVTPY